MSKLADWQDVKQVKLDVKQVKLDVKQVNYKPLKILPSCIPIELYTIIAEYINAEDPICNNLIYWINKSGYYVKQKSADTHETFKNGLLHSFDDEPARFRKFISKKYQFLYCKDGVISKKTQPVYSKDLHIIPGSQSFNLAYCYFLNEAKTTTSYTFIKNLPSSLKTKEMCIVYINQSIDNIFDVPKKILTKDVCEIAYKKLGNDLAVGVNDVLEYFPVEFRQEFIDRYERDYQNADAYVDVDADDYDFEDDFEDDFDDDFEDAD